MANVRGTSRADILRGTTARDRLFGLDGNDRLFGANGHDLLYGGNHNDLLKGDRGNDRLWGHNGNDKLYGGHGHDRLYGHNGVDLLRGQSHNDLLYGGNHNDRLYGDSGADRLYGQNHNDRLYGGDNDDRLYGGNHDDRLYGQNGNDWLYGQNHDDILRGGAGDDSLYGGHGDDLLIGDAGIDLLAGGDGDDVYVVDHGDEIVEVTLDEGYDEVRSSVSFVLGVHQEKLVLLGSDDIDGDATVHGHTRHNVVIGNSGDNVLRSGSGIDRLEGGAGNDVLSAGSGAWTDELFGGPGDDIFFSNQFDVIDGGPGTDAIVFSHDFIHQLTVTSVEVLDLRQATVEAYFDSDQVNLDYYRDRKPLPSAEQVLSWNDDGTLLVVGDPGDVVSGPGSWTLSGTGIVDGVAVRTFTDNGAIVHIEQGIEVAFSSEYDFSGAAPDADGRVDGLTAGARLGRSLDGGADVNGDGFDDFVLGAPGVNGGAGAMYLVFGAEGLDPSTVDLAGLDGTDGVRLDGVGAGDGAGSSVALGGDVNGDGLADLLIAASGADHGGAGTGSVYVVFGSTDFGGATFDLGALNGDNGFRVDGDTSNRLSGANVGRIGDLNGDGIDDIGIGVAELQHTPGEKGSTFIVFGQTEGHAAAMTLDGLDGANGFRFDAVHRAGFGLSGGDLNGDGIDDLVVSSAVRAGPFSQSAHAVFGNDDGFSARMTPADLDGSNGFTVGVTRSALGIAANGDVNGDGLADLLVGHTHPGTTFPLGGFRLIYGSEAAFPQLIDRFDLDGDNGFRTSDTFPDFGSNLGSSAAFLGDVNGDGYDDYAVGSGTDLFPPEGGEHAVVLFGGEGPHPPRWYSEQNGVIDNDFLGGRHGLRISRYGEMKLSVAAAGDLNGDGYDDILLADDDASVAGQAGAGSVFILLGGDFGYGVDLEGTGSGEPLVGGSADERLVAGAGDDYLDGGGGVDVLLAGPGNDVLVFDPSDRRADGGNGVDTLQIDGSGIVLDFDALRPLLVTGIDRIDLTGSGDNTAQLTLADVMQISDFDLLRIDGDVGDTIVSDGQGWQPVVGPPVILDGISYDAWTVDNVRLLVDTDLTPVIS